jgi:hypothetical protein
VPSNEVIPQCPCTYQQANDPHWCSHSVSLIALTSLLQELPAERPAWVRRSCVLPLHTVSAHYLQRYGERFSGDQEKRTLPFISKMMASAQERQITSFKVTFIFIIPFFQPLSSDILFLLNVLQIHFKK